MRINGKLLGILTGSLILLLGSGFVLLSRITDPEKISDRLQVYHQRYGQKKIYLHTDKPSYYATDDIWYKAYVLDAVSHEPDREEVNLYVQLINSFGQTVMTNLNRLENGTTHGDFRLYDTLSEGLYELRAWTNYSRNFGEEFFFRKQLVIRNPEKADLAPRETKKASKRIKKKSIRRASSYDLRFFPEGGQLVEGLTSRVAFKYDDELGIGQSLNGSIFAGKTKIMDLSSEYQGMGSFEIDVQPGVDYYAEIIDPEGKSKKYKFPDILESGVIMKVSQEPEDALKVDIQASPGQRELFLLAHGRGKTVFEQRIQLSGGKVSTRIPWKALPAGILHLTVFNRNAQPLAERLSYIYKVQQLNIQVASDQGSYGQRKEVNLDLLIEDERGNPVEGDFSLSVFSTAGLETPDGSPGNIYEEIMLASDLPGQIINPGHYLDPLNKNRQRHMDLLMMTQGWRRFTWDRLLDPEYDPVRHPVEKGIVVNGLLTRPFFKIPLKQHKVNLVVLNRYNDQFTTYTDDDGEFRFELPAYQDTLQLELNARRKSGRKNLVLYLDHDEPPAPEPIYSQFSADMQIKGSNRYGTVYKTEAEIAAEENPNRLTGIYGNPDNVIYYDESFVSYDNVFDVIRGRVPGVTVTSDDNIIIRGPGTLYGSTDPLYLIDNTPVDVGSVRVLNPIDVERIEIIKGPSAAIYGARGANGIVSIYTKRGKFMKKGVLEFEIQAYQNPREFYSPRYGTEFDDLLPDNRKTLYWKPDLVTGQDGRAKLRFFTSDITGDFDVRIEGVSVKGKIGSGTDQFSVREE